MASGKTHDKASRMLAYYCLGTGVLWGVATQQPEWLGYGLCSGLGAYAGLWLSPDLDLARCNASARWRSLKLGWLWRPYYKAIPHRHWLSHWPIIGTAGRLLYLGSVVALCLSAVWAGLAWGLDMGAKINPPIAMIRGSFGVALPYALAWCIGLALADALHLALDEWG